MEKQGKMLSWSSLFLATFLAAYLYILNEWLFAVTKPSFLNDLGTARQIQILLTTSALLASLCFLALLPLVILGLIFREKRYIRTLIQLSAWLPAVIFAALILLLVDNFTYTVFKFGIVSTDGLSRAVYGLVFIILVVLCYQRTLKALDGVSQRNRIWGFTPKWFMIVLPIVLLLSVAVLAFPSQTLALSLSANNLEGPEVRPHILIITSDGVDATHMSVYGYGRETTPNMSVLAESALVAQNAFSNAGKSAGSVVSLYNGKYPAQTRMLYPPDILKGADSIEHLPGILRSYGYRTVQITVPHYLDASEFNLVDGFDEVKTHKEVPWAHSKYLNELRRVLPSENALFVDDVIKRMFDRTRHIFFIRKMTNPYLLVTEMSEPLADMERLEILQQEIEITRQPIFVHVHLMATHGKTFKPREQTFSAGQPIEAQEPWSDDFYDDTILEFDQNIGSLVDRLKDLDLLDETILVVGSDHGQQWDPLKRLPLIIRFPLGEHAGTIRANVQNLDIAPTILDYIGIDQPEWMAGKSLIAGELEQRPIFGVDAVKDEQDENGNWVVNWDKVAAPFYQFGSINLIYCEKWYKLDLTSYGWETGRVEGTTAACPPGEKITDEQAYDWIVEHLNQNGFDVSALSVFPR